MAHVSALLNVMITAARKAARGLSRDFGEAQSLQISKKGAADFVSRADLAAEQTIFEELSKARPKYGFVMEERGEIEGSDNSNRWIVDPLDGTTNFLHGLPQFAISIALERDRKPHAGVVYNPATDELFWAEKGEGAYLNDRRIRASGRRDLNECLFACGLPFAERPGRERALDEARKVLEQTAGGAPLWRGGARPRLCRRRTFRCVLGARLEYLGRRRRRLPRSRSRRHRQRNRRRR